MESTGMLRVGVAPWSEWVLALSGGIASSLELVNRHQGFASGVQN
jgi:hypothetical protein